MGLFSVIGSIGRALFGGKKDSVSTSPVDFQTRLKEQQENFNAQLARQAQEGKKTMMFMGIGAVVVVMMLFMFMKK